MNLIGQRSTNMKKNILYILCFITLFAATSCTTSRTAAIDDLRDLRNEIRDNGTDYTLHDWNKAANKYGKIQNKLARHTYSNREQEEIGELKGECMSYFAKSVATNFAGSMSRVGSHLKGLLEGLKKGWYE